MMVKGKCERWVSVTSIKLVYVLCIGLVGKGDVGIMMWVEVVGK